MRHGLRRHEERAQGLHRDQVRLARCLPFTSKKRKPHAEPATSSSIVYPCRRVSSCPSRTTTHRSSAGPSRPIAAPPWPRHASCRAKAAVRLRVGHVGRLHLWRVTRQHIQNRLVIAHPRRVKAWPACTAVGGVKFTSRSRFLASGFVDLRKARAAVAPSDSRWACVTARQ